MSTQCAHRHVMSIKSIYCAHNGHKIYVRIRLYREIFKVG